MTNLRKEHQRQHSGEPQHQYPAQKSVVDINLVPQPDSNGDNCDASHDGDVDRRCNVLRVSEGLHFDLAGLKRKIESHPEVHTLVQKKDNDCDIVHLTRTYVDDTA